MDLNNYIKKSLDAGVTVDDLVSEFVKGVEARKTALKEKQNKEAKEKAVEDLRVRAAEAILAYLEAIFPESDSAITVDEIVDILKEQEESMGGLINAYVKLHDITKKQKKDKEEEDTFDISDLFKLFEGMR